MMERLEELGFAVSLVESSYDDGCNATHSGCNQVLVAKRTESLCCLRFTHQSQVLGQHPHDRRPRGVPACRGEVLTLGDHR